MYVEVSNVKRSVGLPFRVRNLLGTSTKVEKSMGHMVLTPIMYLSPWKSLQRLVLQSRDIDPTGFTKLGQDLCSAVVNRGGDHVLLAGTKATDTAMRKLQDKVSKFNACEYACSCPRVCLALTAGRLKYTELQIFEALKTLLFIDDPMGFYEDIVIEVQRLAAKVRRGFTKNKVKYKPNEVQLHVRLNGGSDLDWYSDEYSPIKFLEEMDPSVQFFDYTKDYHRMTEFLDSANTNFPTNYHLTYSAGSRDSWTADVMKQSGNVAVVFREFPTELLGKKTHGGYTFIDGTAHDARIMDPYRSIVCLSPLGWPAKADKTSRFMFNDGQDFLNRVGKHLQAGQTMTI